MGITLNGDNMNRRINKDIILDLIIVKEKQTAKHVSLQCNTLLKRI